MSDAWTPNTFGKIICGVCLRLLIVCTCRYACITKDLRDTWHSWLNWDTCELNHFPLMHSRGSLSHMLCLFIFSQRLQWRLGLEVGNECSWCNGLWSSGSLTVCIPYFCNCVCCCFPRAALSVFNLTHNSTPVTFVRPSHCHSNQSTEKLMALLWETVSQQTDEHCSYSTCEDLSLAAVLL